MAWILTVYDFAPLHRDAIDHHRHNLTELRQDCLQGSAHRILCLNQCEISFRLIDKRGHGFTLIGKNRRNSLGSRRSFKRVWGCEQNTGIDGLARLADKAVITGVLKETAHKISHPGKELTKRDIDAHALTRCAQCTAHRLAHAIQNLVLNRRRRKSKRLGLRLGTGLGADIMGCNRWAQMHPVLDQKVLTALKTGIGERLKWPNRTRVTALRRDNCLVVPVGALNQADPEGCAALDSVVTQLQQISLG